MTDSDHSHTPIPDEAQQLAWATRLVRAQYAVYATELDAISAHNDAERDEAHGQLVVYMHAERYLGNLPSEWHELYRWDESIPPPSTWDELLDMFRSNMWLMVEFMREPRYAHCLDRSRGQAKGLHHVLALLERNDDSEMPSWDMTA